MYAYLSLVPGLSLGSEIKGFFCTKLLPFLIFLNIFLQNYSFILSCRFFLLPGLIQVDGSHQVSPTLLQVPRTTLYGSSNIPLSHAARNITNVRIDLAQFHLGAEGTPCSLDTLGIVPTRSHGRSKFGSLTSLSMFKPHYPTSTLHPVVIRGIAPTSPAAVTQQLHPGMCQIRRIPK